MPISMPNGKLAESIDRIMLMAMWVKHIKKTESKRDKKELIAAGMGKPTFSINGEAVKSALSYWSNVLSKNRQVQALIESDEYLTHDTLDSIVKIGAAIDYDNPQGNDEAREIFARASSRWYETRVTPDEVIFNVGGAAGLYAIFKILNRKFPKSYIMTPSPYYTLYKQSPNPLHFIDLMKREGFKLTAKSIEEGLSEAKALQRDICAILICDPNNPLSTVVSQGEWKKIASILEAHPNILILLDEAYAEMQLNGEKYKSLLSVAPELKKRIVVFRSATKGLSAAGERMAATLIFDPEIMQAMIETTVNIYGHPPVSSQIVYATAVDSLTNKKTLSVTARFHKKQVDFALGLLSKIGINVNDSSYKPEGTFYVLCDLSELYGQPISQDASKILNKRGSTETDEEIAYNLLLKEKIMIAPLSYFGAPETAGYFRITCSEGIEKLNILMHRIARQCLIARKVIQGKLLSSLLRKIDTLFPVKPEIAAKILIDSLEIIKMDALKDSILQSKSILEQNARLNTLLEITDNQIAKSARNQSFFSISNEKLAQKVKHFQKSIALFSEFETSAYENWSQYLEYNSLKKENISLFKQMNFGEKLAFVPWKKFISKFIEKNTRQQSVQPSNSERSMLLPSKL